MAKKPKNGGKTWSMNDVTELRRRAKGNTPTRLIAHELGRSEAAVYSRASDEGISLKPTNQSPYKRRRRKL